METFRPITDTPAGIDVAKERHQVLIDVPGKKAPHDKRPE